ncbi:MAG: hypothetical protein L3K52_13310 [Candidatus Thiothrix sulfatifontis]|nr:MAG: hypothetical protein L3K52_13310 [Candidatus Thiothrix sulfatifontis]
MSNKLDQKIKSLIDTKASTINHKAFYHAQFASTIINQLNDFIDGKLILSEERIVALLDHLVGYYTITLDIPLSIDTKILRAVKFDRLDNRHYL